MVRLRKIRAETPATALGILSFAQQVSDVRVKPEHVIGFALLVSVILLVL